MSDSTADLPDPRPARLVTGVLAGIAVLTAIAIALLWPGDDRPQVAGVSDSELAEVTEVARVACAQPSADDCLEARVDVQSGPDEGTTQTLTFFGETVADLDVGDRIRVTAATAPGGGPPTYVFSDFERGGTLLWLAAAFVAMVLLFARLRGALSLLAWVSVSPSSSASSSRRSSPASPPSPWRWPARWP